MLHRHSFVDNCAHTKFAANENFFTCACSKQQAFTNEMFYKIVSESYFPHIKSSGIFPLTTLQENKHRNTCKPHCLSLKILIAAPFLSINKTMRQIVQRICLSVRRRNFSVTFRYTLWGPRCYFSLMIFQRSLSLCVAVGLKMESWQIDFYVGLDSTDESFWKYYKSSYENTNAPKSWTITTAA